MGHKVQKIRGREDGHKEMPLIMRTQGQKNQGTQKHGPKMPKVDDQRSRRAKDCRRLEELQELLEDG